MKENNSQEIIDALFIIIEEFEEYPIGSANETLLQILSERVEAITLKMNK